MKLGINSIWVISSSYNKTIKAKMLEKFFEKRNDSISLTILIVLSPNSIGNSAQRQHIPYRQFYQCPVVVKNDFQTLNYISVRFVMR